MVGGTGGGFHGWGWLVLVVSSGVAAVVLSSLVITLTFHVLLKYTSSEDDTMQ